MKISGIAILACVLAQVTAQNYGPVPPRPHFTGASLVQAPRPNFRRGNARAIQEPVQQVQEQPQFIQRTRRPVARSRNQFVQPQAFDQTRNIIEPQRNNIVDHQKVNVVEQSKGNIVEHQRTSIVEHPRSSIVEHPRSNIVEHQRSSIVEHPRSSIVEHPRSNIVEHQRTSIVEHPRSNIVEHQRTSIVEHPRSNIVENQRTSIVEHPRSNIIDDILPIQYKPKFTFPTPLPQLQQSQPISQQPLQQLQQQTQSSKLLTPRPVSENDNDASNEETPLPVTTQSTTTSFTTPVRTTFPQSGTILQPNQIPVTYQRPQFVQGSPFRQQTPPIQQLGFPETASLQARQLIRPQVRPALEQPQIPIARPIPQQIFKPKDEPVENTELQYFRQQIRPQKKQEPVRQQIIDQEPLRQREPVRQTIRQQQPVRQPQQEYAVQRPIQREPHVKASHQRERKPVVQTIRKFHEEHEDGSITWGYENDDGSFKEETIGVDCVTRGKYGYYDPDGVKREYTYQTGIPCDRQQQEAEEAASQFEGFIDYTNNKYVLPNGDEIDLEAMVKNRARKPVQRYRN